jgi:hypothetical protein
MWEEGIVERQALTVERNEGRAAMPSVTRSARTNDRGSRRGRRAGVVPGLDLRRARQCRRDRVATEELVRVKHVQKKVEAGSRIARPKVARKLLRRPEVPPESSVATWAVERAHRALELLPVEMKPAAVTVSVERLFAIPALEFVTRADVEVPKAGEEDFHALEAPREVGEQVGFGVERGRR